MTGNGSFSRGTLTTTLLVMLCSACGALWAAPSVRDVTISGAQVGLYEKLELTYDVDTVATNLYWPYDPSPGANTPVHPSAVPVGVGVTVDGQFSKDNWQTTVVQPGFYFQDYERQAYLCGSTNQDWLYPKGAPCWKIRFAPTSLGEWRYRIRVTDASGSTTYEPPANSFTCAESSNPGFVRVSPRDTRYFERSDGGYINYIGLAGSPTCTYDMDTLYQSYGANGVNLLRVWWQGSAGPILFGIGGQGGIPGWYPALVLTGEVAKAGRLFSGKITGNSMASQTVCVKPSTSYRYTAYVKTVGLTGTGDYGAQLRAWACTQLDEPLTQRLTGDTDWTQLSGTVTTYPDQYSLEYLKVMLSNTTGGSAYFTDLSLREILGNEQLGPEMLSRTNFDAEQQVSQWEAWKADYQVELAKQQGIGLKVCLEEKADDVFGRIGADGIVGGPDSNNVYASASHASRTYQQYFWRYIIARYGYATSIHSFEFCNEGDPFNGNHYGATEALAKYVKDNDPSQHLVTTSFWHSFPTREFWASSSYPSIGYADWHQYIGLQSGSSLQYVYGWPNDAVLDKTVYRSAPQSLHVTGVGADARVWGYAFAIVPNHTYTIRCYVRGQGLTATGSGAGDPSWIYPTVGIVFRDGWWSNDLLPAYYPGKAGDFMGTYDWTLWSFTVTAPTTARYMWLSPGCHWAVGDCWFDDITMHDDTAGTEVEVPNGNFDSERLDFDSALMTYSIGTQTGGNANRVVRMPVIRGEVGISGNNVYGDTYKDYYWTGENQQLIDDTDGVWYRKFVWGQVNPSGVIDMYWWKENMVKNGLAKYAKAFQLFMSGIPLSNGNYRDATANTSRTALRAWGQKDLISNRAHLWIDNAPHTWKAVVDHNYSPEAWSGTVTYAKDSTSGGGSPTHIYKSLQANNKNHAVTDAAWWQDTGAFNAASNPPLPPPVTGSVTVPGLRDGKYTVEWWDTSTGAVTRTEELTCTGGNLVLSVSNLQSDIACKISPVQARINLKVMVPSMNVVPGQTVTITVEYTNTGETAAPNITVGARVPAQMTYVAGSAEASGGSYNATTGAVSWVIDSVAAHQKGTRTFQAKVQ